MALAGSAGDWTQYSGQNHEGIPADSILTEGPSAGARGNLAAAPNQRVQFHRGQSRPRLPFGNAGLLK